MNQEQEGFKFPDFFESQNITITDLPEKVQSKIATFDDTYEEYAESEEGSAEEKDLYAKLCAFDNGILSDLQSYVAKRNQDAQTPPQAAQGAQTDNQSQQSNTNTQTETQSDSPSWRFWM
jgi:hypothetical protein